ncbi:MAG: CARDB domain-containing protein [Candidatus Poseidoniia archaeon]|nr:CARDB domain-containing protein [Candidatus Poseidoniia archaeon]MDP7256151.1 CARDB domain-containing protein [Candidatus Poseidoniia archaeon]MDP7474240.1 CARDB domain-containing protein [Candidatus Poseidoniia archaeon]MDP7589902.1 CARDB domain-containing protein [Candidatus Poseidoniia archaeon]
MNPAGSGSLSHTPLSSGDRRKRATGVAALAAVSFLLLALIASPQGGSATSSLVTVSADALTKDAPVGEAVGFVVEFHNTDSDQARSIEPAFQFMDGDSANWSAWWASTDDTPLAPGTRLLIAADGTQEFHFYVRPPAEAAGRSRELWAYGLEGFFEEEERNQTMRPSGAPLLLTVSAVEPYGATLELDASVGVIYQEQQTSFSFTLRSTGAYSDDFTLAVGNGSTLPAEAVAFTPASGRLKGSYDAISKQDREIAGTITVSPDRNLLPGDYTLAIEVSFDSGVTASAQMALTAPEPELHFVTGSFKITSVNELKHDEPFSFEVIVANTGGNVDSNGNFAESIAVRASGDSLDEQTNFVTSLRNGEEATVRFTLTPATGGELTLELQIDSDDSVAERDEGNNVRSEKLTFEAEPELEDDGGLIPAPGILAAATVLLAAARRRR